MTLFQYNKRSRGHTIPASDEELASVTPDGESIYLMGEGVHPKSNAFPGACPHPCLKQTTVFSIHARPHESIAASVTLTTAKDWS